MGFWKVTRAPSALVLILAFFAAANALIVIFADSSCHQIDGACARQHDIYASPTARSLLEDGRLGDPTNPDAPWTYRQWPPISGLVMAVALLTNGGQDLYPLVALQVLMLLAMGFLVRGVLSGHSKGLGDVGLAMVIFNPNALAGAHLPANETLCALLLTTSFVLLYRYGLRRTAGLAAACAAVLALSLLVRPTGQFLIPPMPLIFVLAATTGGGATQWRAGLRHGVVALGVTLAVLAPWLAFQVNAGVGPRIAGPSAEQLHMAFNLSYLTAEMPGEGNGPWRQGFQAEQLTELQRTHPDWDALNVVQQDFLRLDHARSYLLSFPFDARTFGIAFAKSTIRFFVSGGEGEIHSLFGMEGNPAANPAAFWSIKVTAIGYALILRVLGLLGLWMLFVRRDWLLLLTCTGMIVYFWLTSLALGKPRFRLMVEPELMILAAFGVVAVLSLLARPRPSLLALSTGPR